MCNFLEAWDLCEATSGVKESTIRNEKHRFTLHILPYWEGVDFSEIKTKDICLFRNHLFSKELAPKTIKHCLSFMRTLMRRAKLLELYQGSIPYFEMPRFDNRRMRFLTRDEADLLLTTIKKRSELWHDISLFALTTGMRAGEIFSLKPAYVNFKQHSLTIYDTKNNENRSIPMSEIAEGIAFKYASKKLAFVFSNNKIRQVSNVFRLSVREANINTATTERRECIVFHSLRHTFASWLIQDGIALAVVSELLGHKSLEITMRYAHLSPEQGRNAVDLLSSSISSFWSQEKIMK